MMGKFKESNGYHRVFFALSLSLSLFFSLFCCFLHYSLESVSANCKCHLHLNWDSPYTSSNSCSNFCNYTLCSHSFVLLFFCNQVWRGALLLSDFLIHNEERYNPVTMSFFLFKQALHYLIFVVVVGLRFLQKKPSKKLLLPDSADLTSALLWSLGQVLVYAVLYWEEWPKKCFAQVC